jgi:methylase of polypeptide subunit release factors
MDTTASMFPPPHGSADRLRALRDALRAAEFTEAAVAETERVVARQVDAVRVPAVQHALAMRSDPAAVLLALFVYDTPVARGAVEAAVGAAAAHTIVDAGLARADGASLVPAGRLIPFLGVYIAGDRPHAHAEAVMPPGPTTQEIGRALPIEFDGHVLDVATGPGSLAIVAATRGASVVATDVSERALAFARFNAALNGVAVDWRAGSLLEPVAGETFDLVVAQPPFVPCPPALDAVTFAHGGPAGDELAFALLPALPAVLAPDAVALVRFDAPRRSQPLVDRMRAAVGPDVCDLAVVTWPGPSAAHEAVLFASLADAALGDEFRDAVRAYADHLAALGVDEFVAALTIVRAREGVVWTAGVPLPSAPGSWAAVASYVHALDAAGSSDAQLGTTRLAPNPGVVVTAERPLGAEAVAIAFDTRSGSIAARRPSDEATVDFLDAFANGRTPEAVASDLGLERMTLLALTREALAAGHLVVV